VDAARLPTGKPLTARQILKQVNFGTMAVGRMIWPTGSQTSKENFMADAKAGAGIATAAAMLALASIAQAADLVAPVKGRVIHASDPVHCYGANACKGQSDCETATSACKTQNACKGKGWKTLTASKCFAKKGFIGDLILIGQ
jgi:uncharacterized membrane protein